MTNVETAFLQLLRDGISGEMAHDPGLTPSEWNALLSLAKWQKLFPLIYHVSVGTASYRAACDTTIEGPKPDAKSLRESVLREISRQVWQENDLLNILLALREEGIEPLVVKGAVLRQLYPFPLLRPSVDEDLLVLPQEVMAVHTALLNCGLTADDGKADPETVSELSYHRLQSPTYLEVHQALFEPSSAVYGEFNRYFTGCFMRATTVKIQDVFIRTLCPQDHLLFLILHSFKHFVHSGFGLRIAADICLFTKKYADQLEMDAVYSDCRDLRCHRFAAAVYQIGEKYLGVSAPEPFASVQCEIGPLLEDMLKAGIHGQDIDRLHSANITLGTIADEKSGKNTSRGSLRASLFPPASSLKGRYPYLQKNTWLLPFAWTQRICGYLVHPHNNSPSVHPVESVRIGKARVALLRQYGIIGKDDL